MIHRATKEQIELYRFNDAINQSSLKKLLVSLEEFLKEDREPTLPMIIGDAIDTILTGEEGSFEDRFYVSLSTPPSDLVVSILKHIYENSTDKNSELEVQDIESAVNDFEYQKNWKLETRINKILEYSNYYEEIKNSAGKIVISAETKNIIDNVVDSLKYSDKTKHFFDTNTDLEIYFQVPLFWNEPVTCLDNETREIQCKGLVDWVIVEIDENNLVKTIKPFDLKTTSNPSWDFNSIVRMRRYDIQASFYTSGLYSCPTLPFETSKNFTVEPFTFVVESTTSPGNPTIWKCSADILEIGQYGLPEIEFGIRIVRDRIFGYSQLLKLYDYYKRNNFEREALYDWYNSEFTLLWDNIKHLVHDA